MNQFLQRNFMENNHFLLPIIIKKLKINRSFEEIGLTL